MIPFTQQQVNALLKGEEVEFRRKKKEGEHFWCDNTENFCGIYHKNSIGKGVLPNEIKINPRFFIGSSYSVSLKGSCGALWYCPKCKTAVKQPKKKKDEKIGSLSVSRFTEINYSLCGMCCSDLKPLCYLVQSISGTETEWILKGVMKDEK